MTVEGFAQFPGQNPSIKSGSGSLTRDSDNSLKGDGGDLKKPSPSPSPSGSLSREGNTSSSPAPGETSIEKPPIRPAAGGGYDNQPKGPKIPRVATSQKSPEGVSPTEQTSKKTTQTSKEVRVVSVKENYSRVTEINPDETGRRQVVRVNYPDGSHETYWAPIATPAPQTVSGDETKKADGQSAKKESEESNVGLVLLAFIGLCAIGGGGTYLASNR